jgi:hypothetical protein
LERTEEYILDWISQNNSQKNIKMTCQFVVNISRIRKVENRVTDCGTLGSGILRCSSESYIRHLESWSQFNPSVTPSQPHKTDVSTRDSNSCFCLCQNYTLALAKVKTRHQKQLDKHSLLASCKWKRQKDGFPPQMPSNFLKVQLRITI